MMVKDVSIALWRVGICWKGVKGKKLRRRAREGIRQWAFEECNGRSRGEAVGITDGHISSPFASSMTTPSLPLYPLSLENKWMMRTITWDIVGTRDGGFTRARLRP